MSQITIHCFEPDARPSRASLSLDSAEGFALYALRDFRLEAVQGLRVTVLRPARELPPARAYLLLRADVRASRPGELPTIRARHTNAQIPVEIIRPEARSRARANAEWRSGTRLEAQLPDLSSVAFTLEIDSEVNAGAESAGSTRSVSIESTPDLLWAIPTLSTTLSDPQARATSWLLNRASALGLSPALFSPMLVMFALMAGLGYLAFAQYRNAQETQGELEAERAARKGAEASRASALFAEAACIEERQELAVALNDQNTRRALQAEIALSVPLSRAVSIELGGARMSSAEVLAFDQLRTDQMRALVSQEMAKLPELPSQADSCLGLGELLGQDLPRYALLWHPDPALVCSPDYRVITQGVDRAGRWGISTRAQAAFGPSPAEAGDTFSDPRLNERYSVRTLANGLRALQAELLNADTGPRPPVSPGQGQLWALALWDAINRMPAPVEGIPSQPLTSCVSELILLRAAASPPAAPGEPVLPDIVDLAQGERIPLQPTQGCPWDATALQLGAQAAVRAVARLGQTGLGEY